MYMWRHHCLCGSIVNNISSSTPPIRHNRLSSHTLTCMYFLWLHEINKFVYSKVNCWYLREKKPAHRQKSIFTREKKNIFLYYKRNHSRKCRETDFFFKYERVNLLRYHLLKYILESSAVFCVMFHNNFFISPVIFFVFFLLLSNKISSLT